jgi:hypothetical protein
LNDLFKQQAYGLLFLDLFLQDRVAVTQHVDLTLQLLTCKSITTGRLRHRLMLNVLSQKT